MAALIRLGHGYPPWSMPATRSGRSRLQARQDYDGTARSPFTGDQIPASQMSSAAQKMTALIPLPNYGTPGSIADNYFTSDDLLWDRDSIDLKMNYNPSDRITIFGRYSTEPTFISDLSCH